MQYNFEFLPYFRHPEFAKPSVLASPSYWKIDEVKSLNVAPVEYLPVPIDIEKIPFRKMKNVKTFVHILGRAAKNDRNGTIQFLNMALDPKMKKFNFLIYAQQPKEPSTIEEFNKVAEKYNQVKRVLGKRLQMVFDVKNNADLYAKGEIMVIPRKYAGLCLPLWESLSAGMPVVMTNIDPNNKVLPPSWLCTAHFSGDSGLSNGIFMYEADVDNLVDMCITLSKSISSANNKARQLAEEMSWETRKPKYIEMFKKYVEDCRL